MRIRDIEVADTPSGARLSGNVLWDNNARDRVDFLYSSVPASSVTGGPEALLASMLIPAMAVGEDIHMEAPVSARLLAGIEKIVRINKEWHPRFHQTRVEAPARDGLPTGAGGIATFFSGGADSFYSILRPRPAPVTTLLTIVGFDLRFEKRAFAEPIVSRLRHAAETLDRSLVVVDSNAFEIGHKYVYHAEHHGAFLAATALALGELRLCYIPSSWTLWRSMPPFGSHPATDPLWSSDELEFVHDGAEISRTEKLFAIADNPVVLDNLRVCVRRPDLYNCGRCAKCVSTALTLQLAGTIDRCSTLGRVTPDDVRRARLGGPYHEVYRELLRNTDDPQLRRALKGALRFGRLQKAVRPLLDVERRRRLRVRIRRFEASGQARR